MTRGRGWAYTGATLGAVVSIAANVAHSYVPPAGATGRWTPHTGAVIGAVFWPVALLVAVEILARVDWPAGNRWVALRWLGLLPVAVVAAVVSYRHLSGLLDWYGEDRLTSTIGPLAVDGLMVMATGALIATARMETQECAAPAAGTSSTASATETPAPTAGHGSESWKKPAQTVGIHSANTAPHHSAAPTAGPATATTAASSSRRTDRVGADPDALLPAAQQAARAIRARGENLSRDRLLAQLRADGHPCGPARASRLLAAVREIESLEEATR